MERSKLPALIAERHLMGRDRDIGETSSKPHALRRLKNDVMIEWENGEMTSKHDTCVTLRPIKNLATGGEDDLTLIHS